MILLALTLLVTQQQPPILVPIKEEYFTLPVAPPPCWPNQGTLRHRIPGAPEALIKVYTNEKRVELHWLVGDVPSPQVVTVAYWPTAAAAVNGRLVVAGKRRNLSTVIEVWEFDDPMPPSGANYVAAFTKRILYDANVPGKRRVRFLNPILSPDGERAMLVHFGDSNDVFQIDVTTGAMTLVLTVQQQPALSIHELQGIWIIDHSSAGYLYVYQGAEDAMETLVLIDANKDGIIDSSAYQAADLWRQGLGNPASWLGVNEG